MEVTLIDEAEEIGATCRCCLTFSEDEIMDNIFECVYQDIELHEILNLIVPNTIQFDDGYSQSICENCKASAVEAFCFRQLCISSSERMCIEAIEIHNEEEPQEEEIVETLVEESYGAHIEPEPAELLQQFYVEPNFEVEEIADESVCPFCQETFTSSSELTVHVDNVHQFESEVSLETESNYVCTVCEKVCGSQVFLNLHVKLHEQPKYDNEQIHGEPSNRKTESNSSRKHECPFCSKRFETPSKVQRHIIVHRDILHPSDIPKRPPKEYKYICGICEKLVETPSKLHRHMHVHEKNLKTYDGVNQHRPHPCLKCDQRFWDKAKLERHQVIHSEGFEKSKIIHAEGHLFTCVICLEKLPGFEECMQHMRNHREDYGENTEIACKLCPKVYPKLVNLIRHSKVHPENATHQCIHCGKQMGMGDDFIDHFLRHEDFKPFTCTFPSCGKKFVKVHKLRQHMQTHIEDKPVLFACNQCDKSFAEQEYLKRHLMRHSGRKDHFCTICPARFTFKSGLNSHMTTHTSEKSFSCDLCSSKFTKLASLRMHQKIHTGEKKFVCDFCNMRFITSGHLRRHELSHNGVKPYQCQYCGKAYSQSNDLIKHLRTHLGPNVYRCDIEDCSESFAKFTELKNHKMIHYNSSEMLTEEAYGGDIDSMKLL